MTESGIDFRLDWVQVKAFTFLKLICLDECDGHS